MCRPAGRARSVELLPAIAEDMKLWILTLLPVSALAHMVSMSTGELKVAGNRAEYELKMPSYEAEHVKDPERSACWPTSISAAAAWKGSYCRRVAAIRTVPMNARRVIRFRSRWTAWTWSARSLRSLCPITSTCCALTGAIKPIRPFSTSPTPPLSCASGRPRPGRFS